MCPEGTTGEDPALNPISQPMPTEPVQDGGQPGTIGPKPQESSGETIIAPLPVIAGAGALILVAILVG